MGWLRNFLSRRKISSGEAGEDSSFYDEDIIENDKEIRLDLQDPSRIIYKEFGMRDSGELTRRRIFPSSCIDMIAEAETMTPIAPRQDKEVSSETLFRQVGKRISTKELNDHSTHLSPSQLEMANHISKSLCQMKHEIADISAGLASLVGES